MRAFTEGGAAKQRLSCSDLPPEAVDATWQRFNESCEEALRVGKLGLIVFQYHLGFKPSEANHELVRDCRSLPSAPPSCGRGRDQHDDGRTPMIAGRIPARSNFRRSRGGHGAVTGPRSTRPNFWRVCFPAPADGSV